MRRKLADEQLFEGTPYRCLGQIGAGGMGSVFLVEHREIGKHFAAKVIHSELVPDEKAIDRFRLEAQSLAHIDHPNIVEVCGTGATNDGRPFVVLEFLEGNTLSEELRKAPPSQETALNYAKQYLSALQAAHSAGIVHRDLKPGNIFITKDADDSPRVKVLDFGLAKVLPDAPTNAPSPLLDPTTIGAAIGTPSYMSPEQATGHETTQAGDIYAAAVVLYKSLAGVGPFEHLGLDRQMEAHATMIPDPPSKRSRERISKSLDNIVMRGLSKESAKRFASAQAFLDALSLGIEERSPAGGTPGVKSNELEKLNIFRQTGIFFLVVVVTTALAISAQILL